MKSAKRILSTVLLSVSLIASSFPSVYANTENAVTNAKLGAIQAKEAIPSFLAGDLTAESDKTPQQIVEQYVAQESQKNNLPQIQFKVTEQFVNSLNKTVVKTIQTYNGVPVQNSDRNFFINTDGVIVYIVGNYVYDIADRVSLAVKPADVSQETILSVIEEDLGFKPVYTEAPKSQLLLYPVDGKYDYIYKVNIKFNNPTFKSYVYYIYASNLSILGKNNQELNLEEPAVGSGMGQSGVKQPLKMVKDNNVYYLKNTVENLKTIHQLDGTYSENDNYFNTDTGTNYQKDAVDAHYNMTNIINFFKGSPFYRNGNDDNGSEYTIEIIKDSSNVFNAFADINNVRIGVGEGLAGKSVAAAVDAIAHEYTHGILSSEGLGDSDGHFEFNPPLTERLSLHEGISDVFGTICEYFLPSEGTPDWIIGEDTGTVFRDCTNPVIDNYSEYQSRILACEENKSLKYPKPHEGGGVITKAASLMALGGTFNNTVVEAIGMDKIANIFYHAINDGYIVYDMKYIQFASALLQSAETLYGENSIEAITVRRALGAVDLDLRILQSSGTTLQITWLPFDEASSQYGLYRKETGSTAEPELIVATPNTTLSFTAVLGSYYYIAKVDGNGNRVSEFGNPITRFSSHLAPQNFRIANRSGLSIGFEWDGTIGKRYAIYRQAEGSEDSPEKCVETTNTTAIVDTLYGSYNYYVVQIDDNGDIISSLSNSVLVETLYNAPQNFHITNRSGLQINFTWGGTSGARYAIYKVATGTTDLPEKCMETTDTTLTVETLIGSYDFYVAQIDEAGNRISYLSGPITVIS